MHRALLLDRLAEYHGRYPHEAGVVAQIETFVRGHPDCFERRCLPGHITGSAWIDDPQGNEVLLTHHRKLGIWVQLGGHSDGEPDTLAVARREGHEESGLALEVRDAAIFDLNVHEIPARGAEPAHLHYDVRFWLRARAREFTVSDESHALDWVGADDVPRRSGDASVLRMLHKWRLRC